MKLLWQIILGVTAFLAVVACSSHKAAPEEHEVALTNESAPLYFDQFKASTLGDCKDGAEWTFFSSLTGLIVKTKPTVVAFVQLELLDEGKYRGSYKEGGEAKESLLEKKITGTWKVDGTRLVISGLGSGRAYHNDHVEMVYFTFEKTDLNPALEGQSVFMGKSTSTVGMDGETDFCTKKQ